MNKDILTKKKLEQALSGLSTPPLDHSARARIQQALMFEFRRVTEAPQLRYRRTAEHGFKHLLLRPMISIVLVIVMLVGGAGTVIAADQAKPGDPLYGVDRAIEQVQLNFTPNGPAKAAHIVDLVREREDEQRALIEANESALADEAEAQVSRALENATQVIREVRDRKAEDGDQSRAVEALTEVEDRLQGLRERHEERFNERLQQPDANVQVEVKIYSAGAKVEVHADGLESQFVLTTTDQDEIVSAIALRTGLTESAIRAVMKVEFEDQDEVSDDSPSNTNSNTNNNVNQNTNTDDFDDNEDGDDNGRRGNSNANTAGNNSNDDDTDKNEDGNGSGLNSINSNVNANDLLNTSSDDSDGPDGEDSDGPDN